jgi:Flp pilus assembly protein TadG
MDGDNSRSPVVTALLSFVILAIISLGIYAGLHYYQRRNAERTAAQTNAPAATTTNPGTNDQTLPAQPPDANASPAPATASATDGLNVQIKAKGEAVWMRTRVDEEPNSDGILAADQVRDFKPNERLSVQFS